MLDALQGWPRGKGKQQGCDSKYFLHCLVLHCLECERIAAIVVIIRVREAAADDAFLSDLEHHRRGGFVKFFVVYFCSFRGKCYLCQYICLYNPKIIFNMRVFKKWMLAAILICGTSVFMACSSNEDTPVPQPDINLAEKIVGKWMTAELDGKP